MIFLIIIAIIGLIIWLACNSSSSDTDPQNPSEADLLNQAAIDEYFAKQRERRHKIQEDYRREKEMSKIAAKLLNHGQDNSASKESVFLNAADIDAQGLKGPWLLDAENLKNALNAPSPGCFAVGSMISEGVLLVEAIGRSGTNVGLELINKISLHSHFMLKLEESSRDAFETECRLYHLYGKKIGMKHPLRSPKEPWSCVKCGIYNPGS